MKRRWLLSTTLERQCDGSGLESLDALLLPVSSAVRDWPVVSLSDATAFYIRQGQPVIVPHAPTSGRVQLMEQSAMDRNRCSLVWARYSMTGA